MDQPMTAEEAWQDLCEKDDRTSPAEYPEMCLITYEELADYMAGAHDADAVIQHLAERLQAIIDWADLALKLREEFDSHGVRNLDGPVFDAAREVLAALFTATAGEGK